MSIKGVLALVGYIGTIVAANYSITHWGMCSDQGPCVIPVAPDLYAPSGVVFVGLSFTLRDMVQELCGRRWAAFAILLGALLSALFSPALALASGTAFLLSEFADFIVYTPLRKRSMLLAVGVSNTVGLVIDSVLFLWLAFGSLALLLGQVVGKLEMTVLALVVLALVRKDRRDHILPIQDA